jgi:hypothetical protein
MKIQAELPRAEKHNRRQVRNAPRIFPYARYVVQLGNETLFMRDPDPPGGGVR